MRTRRWYIGLDKSWSFRAFRSTYTPNPRKHGRKFAYVIGPFRTARGARWAERFGLGNPAFTHVDAAERIAKLQAEARA